LIGLQCRVEDGLGFCHTFSPLCSFYNFSDTKLERKILESVSFRFANTFLHINTNLVIFGGKSDIVCKILSNVYDPEDFAAPLLHLFHEQFWYLDNTFLSPFVPENKNTDKDYDLSVLHLHASSCIGPPQGWPISKMTKLHLESTFVGLRNVSVGLHARSRIFEPAKLPSFFKLLLVAKASSSVVNVIKDCVLLRLCFSKHDTNSFDLDWLLTLVTSTRVLTSAITSSGKKNGKHNQLFCSLQKRPSFC
jgi:hypothetical protein